MTFDTSVCNGCLDYNEIYMKANGELYCACDKCREDREREYQEQIDWDYKAHEDIKP